jgi:quercetin dioxygenase-like cupin family protein
MIISVRGHLKHVAVLGTALAWVLAAQVTEPSAQEVSYQALVQPVLSGDKTVLGEDIAYPSGSPKITGAIVTLPPGAQTGWHIHPVPLFAYILEGELVVDYGARGKRTYRKGDAFLEAMGTAHNGSNSGTQAVRILAVYMGADGQPNASARPGPDRPAGSLQ